MPVPRSAEFSQSTIRIAKFAGQWCGESSDDGGEAEIVVAALLVGMLLDDSLASQCLKQHGVSCEAVGAGLLGPQATTIINLEGSRYEEPGAPQEMTTAQFDPATEPASVRSILRQARSIQRRNRPDSEISSEYLLLAILGGNSDVAAALSEHGPGTQSVRDWFELDPPSPGVPLQLDEPIVLDEPNADVVKAGADLSTVPGIGLPSEHVAGSGVGNRTPVVESVLRVLDANLNRAREALRVLDDYARFILNSGSATERIKALRHKLAALEQHVRMPQMNRDVVGDVGTGITTTTEAKRDSPTHVAAVNCRRLQESLRSLEEFGKLANPQFAEAAKQLRYQSYQIEQWLTLHGTKGPSGTGMRRISDSVRLCVLLTESGCRLPWKDVVAELLSCGVGMIQLREKHLDDRDLIERAKWLVAEAESTDTRIIINDRPDIALISGAAGVHVGQTETSLPDIRSLSPQLICGLSTHSRNEAEDALMQEADYLGVGPVFPSGTKQFAEFAGLESVRSAAALGTDVPWFAIGGISRENVDQVVEAGATRIAVSGAVIASDSPGAAADQLTAALHRK